MGTGQSKADKLRIERQEQVTKRLMQRVRELEMQYTSPQTPTNDPVETARYEQEMKRMIEGVQELKTQEQTSPQTQTKDPVETARAEVNPAPSNTVSSRRTEQRNATGNANIPRNTLYPNLDNAKSTLTGQAMVHQHKPFTYLPQTTRGTSTSQPTSTSSCGTSEKIERFQPTAPPESLFSRATQDDLYSDKCIASYDYEAYRARKDKESGKGDFKKLLHCPNRNDGCPLVSTEKAKIDSHSKECTSGDLDCPFNAFGESCNWRGKISHIRGHFIDEHPQNICGNKDREHTISEFKNTSYNVQFIDMGSLRFMAHLKVSPTEGFVIMNVQLLDTESSASNWLYELIVYNKGNPGQKYKFTGSCCSLGTPKTEIFDKSKCTLIPLSYARSPNKLRNSLTYMICIKIRLNKNLK